MSKLVFTILCAVGILLWNKWRQDPEIFNNFFHKFYGSGGSLDGGSGNHPVNTKAKLDPTLGSEDLHVRRARLRSSSEHGLPYLSARRKGKRDPDDKDNRDGGERGRNSSRDRNGKRPIGRNDDDRSRGRGRGRSEERHSRPDRNFRDDNRERREIQGGELNDAAGLTGRQANLEHVGPADTREPASDSAAVPITKKKKKRRKDRAGVPGESEDDRGRSLAHSSGDETREGDRNGGKGKQGTRSEKEEYREREGRGEHERPSSETLRQERLARLEQEARLREEREERERYRGEREGQRGDRGDIQTRGVEQRGAQAGREPYQDRMATGRGEQRGTPGQGEYGVDRGGYEHQAAYQGPGGGRPMYQLPTGGQYGSEGQQPNYSSRQQPGYPAQQPGYLGEGYQGPAGAQLNDTRANVQHPNQYSNNSDPYGRQGRNGEYYDSRGRVIPPPLQDDSRYRVRDNEEPFSDIGDRGRGAVDRQQQSRTEADKRTEEAEERRAELIAKVQRIQAIKAQEARNVRARGGRLESTEQKIELADISASDATKKHWDVKEATTNVQHGKEHGTHHASNPTAVSYGSDVPTGKHSAGHAPSATTGGHSATPPLQLADLPPSPQADRPYFDVSRTRLDAHQPKVKHQVGNNDTSAPAPHHSTAPAPHNTRMAGHIPTTKVKDVELSDLPPAHKEKLSASVAARQHWEKKQSEGANVSKKPSEHTELQLNDIPGVHGQPFEAKSRKQREEVSASQHQVPAEFHRQGKAVSAHSGSNSTSVPMTIEDAHLGQQKVPRYDEVYRGKVDPAPGHPPMYEEGLSSEDARTLVPVNWDSGIDPHSIVSNSKSQREAYRKPSSSSGRDAEPKRNWRDEKERIRGNGVIPLQDVSKENIPDFSEQYEWGRHARETESRANAAVSNEFRTPQHTNITLNNLAPESISETEQSKASGSSLVSDVKQRLAPPARDRKQKGKFTEQDVGSILKEASYFTQETDQILQNEYPREKLSRSEMSNLAVVADKTHLTQSSVQPASIVAQVQMPEDNPGLLLNSSYGSQKPLDTRDIVDAALVEHRVNLVAESRAQEGITLHDMKSDSSHKTESRSKPSSKTTSTSRFQSETSDSLRTSFKSLCRNAKACKKRTISSAVLCVAYIAATYFGSSLLIDHAPAAAAAVAASAAGVVKRQAVTNATGIATDAITSVNDAFQNTGFLMGILHGHVLLISMSWHLVAQLAIVSLLCSIYSYEPKAGKQDDEKSGAGKTASPVIKKGSFWNRITNRASRTRNWSRRNMGRWSWARYGLTLALFLVSLIIARQLTSLSYISRNPTDAEPWSTFPDVTLFYGKLRASQAGLASGISLVQVSMLFWIMIAFSGSYCMSAPGNKAAARAADLESGKATV
ncbi:hypothetical protein QFC21_004382 [Naganishia friedmannii]|uniref:Uncharacterized protein n=1 Tax=Naganishia friedmannii TaxID=89922 RepID=A0ACC2VHU1_9TREE|nr:hypothetical protein QFC21_004382 [Naganishia friedmannii]